MFFDLDYHALAIHENAFNHVMEKFIYIHFNDFLVRTCVTESRCDDFLNNHMCPCKDVTDKTQGKINLHFLLLYSTTCNKLINC